MNDKTKEVFANAPIVQVILKNAVPAMIAMLMTLIYNLADTFFIGQTHNDILVAAVSLATPAFLLFMAVGNIFGIGGTSVISRALGENRPDYAKKVCAFCMWSCVFLGLILSAVFLLFMKPILLLVGASADTWEPVGSYLRIVACSGPFALIASCFSNILRAEGQPNRAMLGQLLGNFLNIILDPIMILGFNWGIAGAAFATVVGNLAAAGYYLVYFWRGKSSLSINIRDFSLSGNIASSVLVIGVPASLGSLMMSVSQIIVNAQMAQYDDMALAGMGVAMKVTMITGFICIGFGQGVQPLLGYCVGARLWERFKEIMRYSLGFAFGLSLIMTGLCYLLRERIVGVFLTEPAAFDYAVSFTSILLSTSCLFGVFFVFCNALQAMGAATPAFVTNISRQGVIYIPALFVLQAVFGITGLIWAQPVADLLSTILVAALYFWTLNKQASAKAVAFKLILS